MICKIQVDAIAVQRIYYLIYYITTLYEHTVHMDSTKTVGKMQVHQSKSTNKSTLKSMNKTNLTVDQLFPSETNKSGTKGKRLDINTLFSGTATNPDIVIEMNHEVLLDRKRKRKDDLYRQYMLAYKNCWTKIDAADNDGFNETVFEVLPNIPEHPEYSPIECLRLIQTNLRNEYIDTELLDDGVSIFIMWNNIEDNRDIQHNQNIRASNDENENNDDDDRCKRDMKREFNKKIASYTDTDAVSSDNGK